MICGRDGSYDHPAAIDVVTNEKFKSPPFPEFRLFGVDRRVYPVSARDSEGRDVRAALLKRDRVYPDSFQRDHAGVAELHALAGDLEREDTAEGVRVVARLPATVAERYERFVAPNGAQPA